ncbi:MAG: hydroxymethylbilane synthase [Cellulomonadaceae bacterium]|jgi:hydroxymethylbilane synthase|nr:hydroxymethylbilane synthase [Cellulomonadaceae bacterium]
MGTAQLEQINVGICAGAVQTMHTNEAAGNLSALTGLPNELVTIAVGRSSGALGGVNPVPAMREALKSGRIDVAIHCVDEMPFDHSEHGLTYITPRRGSIKEALCTTSGAEMAALPRGSRVSADTDLRAATLRALRPDLEVVETFGTLAQRLNQLVAPGADLDAAIVSYADLATIRRTELVTEVLNFDTLPPVAGQGAVAIEVRNDLLKGNPKLKTAFEKLDHKPTRMGIRAERALVYRLLEHGCTQPVAAWGRVEGSDLVLSACIIPLGGAEQLRHQSRVSLPSEAQLAKATPAELDGISTALGHRVADRLLAQGATQLNQTDPKVPTGVATRRRTQSAG